MFKSLLNVEQAKADAAREERSVRWKRYVIIAAIVLVVAALFIFVRLPSA